VKNAKKLAEELRMIGWRVVTGGTHTYIILVDTWMSGEWISEKEASEKIREAGITVNKNTIPYNTRKPTNPSGVCIGTPAVTTQSMKEKDIILLGHNINHVLRS